MYMHVYENYKYLFPHLLIHFPSTLTFKILISVGNEKSKYKVVVPHYLIRL